MKLFDGAKLKQMRLDAKLTQYDLAPLTNITQTRISDIERNVRQPLPKEIDAFMAVFGKTKADFLSDEREIVVISGTFTKTKKDGKPPHPPEFLAETRPAGDRGATGALIDTKSEQLELFSGTDVQLGSDLAGFVLIRADTYNELVESQAKLHKMQSLLK
ncbi:TPA: helix-turn-helix transcriptional regulator [Streptococcus suis]|uniref:helix-turn-helix domain-containing protein n=1 Tax=Streptococcus suis TaxID=1307 RepID=UPI001EE989FB|nr:helix-turn-helix transcriptional regulator [Streptococcus suis]MBS7951722.1 helix-turn-helix transcriptional regulator [Streptococcus suis]MBS7979728.1 helix-turn-helix transcriptional regulator [Streptococcus suis]HEM2987966.1 helix-turn-helix transcriptional regulator [Streptococcus suis]HEM6544395.1 helix-turn-helix transcriptional regulator [Streptococcus suis]HEM6568954.1 helix-turn-helix transcriptional regulator [Streptococcus suis]